jgi:hypothetical protein
MTRSKTAVDLAVRVSGVVQLRRTDGGIDVKDTTVSVQMSLPQVLFSLSSASTLLLPLALCAYAHLHHRRC